MNVPKFTPGPWVVEDHTHRNGVETFRICHGRIGEVVAFMESRDSEADAYLIAAAPDLYDMLASVENDDGRIPGWLWDGIQSTLAKARGETQ